MVVAIGLIAGLSADWPAVGATVGKESRPPLPPPPDAAAASQPAAKPEKTTPAPAAERAAPQPDTPGKVSPPASSTPPPAPAQAAPPAPAPTAPGKGDKPAPKYSMAPLPKGTKQGSMHGPYDAATCSLCHKSDDVNKPGPIIKPLVTMCLDCHDEFKKLTNRKFAHAPAKQNCTACHNPHNSAHPKLLLDEMNKLCTSCHEPIQKLLTGAKVKHDAMTLEKKCSNCHNPHGADVEHLLVQLPFDLCLKCHSKDDMVDGDGKKLSNFKKWLDENKNWHAPVAAKDCSACHKPHGSDHFRLLGAEYPPQFYSPYEPKNYAVCFECHNDDMLKTPETDKLPQFRDGNRNLHYLHVNKPDRGRTCRACHEVHASTQAHHIRDAVPYGPKGWMLKINYTKTETGGSCERTCHTQKTYNNKPLKTPAAAPSAAPAPAAAPASPSAAAPASAPPKP